jgi:hypothetical protein
MRCHTGNDFVAAKGLHFVRSLAIIEKIGIQGFVVHIAAAIMSGYLLPHVGEFDMKEYCRCVDPRADPNLANLAKTEHAAVEPRVARMYLGKHVGATVDDPSAEIKDIEQCAENFLATVVRLDSKSRHVTYAASTPAESVDFPLV